MFHFCIYIASIVLANIGFEYISPVILPNGTIWPPISLVVGFTFVVRDFAQRELGHKVLFAMLIGCVASYYMASPEIAIASMLSFSIGELFDWSLYSFSKKPFSQRVLISSAVATPIDTFVFLSLIGMFSWTTLVVMTASKMFGAFVIYFSIRKKDLALAEKSVPLR